MYAQLKHRYRVDYLLVQLKLHWPTLKDKLRYDYEHATDPEPPKEEKL
jgi:hypothetical protein